MYSGSVKVKELSLTIGVKVAIGVRFLGWVKDVVNDSISQIPDAASLPAPFRRVPVQSELKKHRRSFNGT